MDKLRMESPDMTALNIDRIAALFPNCITEMLDEEHSTPEKKVYKRAVNFELLKQMLSPDVVDGDEAYEFTWVGKKAAIVEANKPIRKTLRPVLKDETIPTGADSEGKPYCSSGSKDWDTTENLYIEGDNLEVLKLLQESYLGKVKMIYIDPPYNTGNDFIYADDFMRSQEEENEQMGMYDEDENRLFKNTDTNGRFHSDWCSMIYSRLMLARNLLTDDGVVFISIDDNEQENLKKCCDEVFGESNFVGKIAVVNNLKGRNDRKDIATCHEYILIYGKSEFAANGMPLTDEQKAQFDKVDENGSAYQLRDLRKRGRPDRREDRPNMYFPIYYNLETKKCSLVEEPNAVAIYPIRGDGSDGRWRWGKERVAANLAILEPRYSSIAKRWGIEHRVYLNPSLNPVNLDEEDTEDTERSSKSKSFWIGGELSNDVGRRQLKTIFGAAYFDYPKSIDYILNTIYMGSDSDSIILDFFSGSATTAHAVMQLNAEDGGHRKFIMVQLPEKCDEASEAYKAGYKNICEIGKERIRRAGDKIKSEIDVVHKDDYAALVESQQSNDQKVMTGFDSLKSSGVLTEKGYTYTDKDTKDISRITYSAENPNDFYRFHPNALDVGFRVLKLDETNMKDVYYAPDDYDQGMLAGLESNIKDDRTDLDLLFGCLIDWGLPLSLPYKSEQIDGCTVHTYNDGDLIACFDANIPESVVKEIAQRKPLRAVFRDSGFASSPEKINVFEIFKLYMPEDAGDISKRVRVI